MDANSTGPVFWFGIYKGRPLAEVDSGYLAWALRTDKVKLSSGVRAAVVAELERRGVASPPPPPPPPPPTCHQCGGVDILYGWMQLVTGVRRIKRLCRSCGRSLGFAPEVEPYLSYASASATPAPLLDVLVQAEELGIDLVSDGLAVHIRRGWDRAPLAFRQRLNECRRDLARMLGKTTVGARS